MGEFQDAAGWLEEAIESAKYFQLSLLLMFLTIFWLEDKMCFPDVYMHLEVSKFVDVERLHQTVAYSCHLLKMSQCNRRNIP